MTGVTHLITCHCVLPIYKKKQKVINHKFVVYSKIGEKNKIIPKLVKCNNCDTLHNVFDICKSEIKVGKDQSDIMTSKEDIELMLPERLVKVLEKYNCDTYIWEHVLDIIDNSNWGEFVVIKRDIIDEQQHVKILEVNGQNNFRIKNEVINDTIYSG